ncbi:hypothetical protein [Nitrosomonas marina]|uniref:Uncharacterized protein n=1 Tax=Nitrosomonas marina TaxID=917 RepID=A0A1H8CSL5_9PROT|nr:hypothetical protein [Nitrosomonas marina]SEM97137.1 hypothetical protein SAMN05216325_10586 [Nitrosomonas marina]
MANKDAKGNKNITVEEARRIVEEELREITDRYRELYERERRMSAELESLRRTSSSVESSKDTRVNTAACTACGGTGKRKCVQCDGRGWFYNQRPNTRERCPICNESGYVKCRGCSGKGYR